METSLTLVKTDYITRLFEFSHNHSRKIEVAIRLIEAIGAGFLLLSFIMEAHVLLVAAAGLSIIGAMEVSLFCLDLLGIIKVNPKAHVYKPTSVNNSRLYYEGDLPVLKIRASTNDQAGFDHGYLIAPQVVSVMRRLNILQRLGHISITKEIATKLEEVKKSIPSEYMEELKGLVRGVNRREKEDSWWPTTVTVDDAIKLHLLPDLMHLALAPNCLFGCSAVMGKDENSGLTAVGRNLDWPGFGLGRLSLLLDQKVGHTNQLLMPTIPGCVGAITGLNKDLFVSINVTEPKKRIDDVKSGIPSLFLNRMVLENCKTLDEVAEFINLDDKKRRPAVPYHMFVADKVGGSFYHFLQGENGETAVRPFKEDQDDAFFTLNCNHPDGEKPTKVNTLYYGSARYNNIQNIWKKSAHLPLSERLKIIMRAPGVNNPMTVHSILWMGDHLVISFDNSFAGTGQKCVVFLDQQFETPAG